MTLKDDLLKSVANRIQDYRIGELQPPTPGKVNRWLNQFELQGQTEIQFLKEIDHVLESSYVSKSLLIAYLEEIATDNKITGGNHSDFWLKSNFLDIQEQSKSQKDMLQLFAQVLSQKFGLDIDECGSENSVYVYLDDVLFSGSRVTSDLEKWVPTQCPFQAHIIILIPIIHLYGDYDLGRKLDQLNTTSKKKFSFRIHNSYVVENRLRYKNDSQVLWPTVIPEHPAVAAFMKTINPSHVKLRDVGGKAEWPFSSEEGRQVLERELLIAGSKIRIRCKVPDVHKPLGFNKFGLGFGSTIVTYRNCPNNCPLALWWGDELGEHGNLGWYALLERKPNEKKGLKGFFY